MYVDKLIEYKYITLRFYSKQAMLYLNSLELMNNNLDCNYYVKVIFNKG